jgi:hypothetical protein
LTSDVLEWFRAQLAAERRQQVFDMKSGELERQFAALSQEIREARVELARQLGTCTHKRLASALRHKPVNICSV